MERGAAGAPPDGVDGVEHFTWTLQYDSLQRDGRLDRVPAGLEHLASVSSEVGLATRALWARSIVIPFGVDGVTYPARRPTDRPDLPRLSALPSDMRRDLLGMWATLVLRIASV